MVSLEVDNLVIFTISEIWSDSDKSPPSYHYQTKYGGRDLIKIKGTTVQGAVMAVIIW